MKFEVLYENNCLSLKNYSLGLKEEKYIQEYLVQINKYKVIGYSELSPVFSLYQPPLATQAGIRSLEGRLRRKFQLSRFPASATISLTKACQCECVHCSAVFYNHSGKENLSNENLIKALSQTVALGVTTLILLGGEPLLRKNLNQIIRSIDKEKTTVILFTNGEYLSSETCRELKSSGLLGAFVSFDSWREDEHDRLRERKGLFKKALCAIDNMNQAGLISGVSSYLSPQRLSENGFEKMIHFTKEIGARKILPRLVHNTFL